VLLFGGGCGFLGGRPLRFGITPVLGISFFGGLPLRLATIGVVSETITSFGFSVTNLILFTCTTNLSFGNVLATLLINFIIS
jgi:hypothetical protein